MNRLTLRHRLLLLTLLPSAVIAIALVTYFTISGIRTLEGELRTKGMATVRYLAPISEYGIIAGQVESLHGLAQATVQEAGVKAAIIVNQKGRAIAVSGRVSLASETLRQTLSEPSQVAETDRWVAFGAPVRRSLNEADTLFEPAETPGEAGPPECRFLTVPGCRGYRNAAWTGRPRRRRRDCSGRLGWLPWHGRGWRPRTARGCI